MVGQEAREDQPKLQISGSCSDRLWPLGHFEAILYSGSHGTALAANLG